MARHVRARRGAPTRAGIVASVAIVAAIASAIALPPAFDHGGAVGSPTLPGGGLIPPAYATHEMVPCQADHLSTSPGVSFEFLSPDDTYKLNDTVVIRVTVDSGKVLHVNYGYGAYIAQTRLALNLSSSENFAVPTNQTYTVPVGHVDYKYTVKAGDYSKYLDYRSTTALYWRVHDYAANILVTDNNDPVRCILPNPGASGSLSAQRSVLADGIIPRVLNVTATDGAYANGSAVPISVNFGEKIIVREGLEPSLVLNVSGAERTAAYTGGNESSTLEFSYMVQADDVDGRVGYNSTAALIGMNVTDIAGNAANLTLAAPGANGSLAFSSSVAIDNTKPRVESVFSSNESRAYARGETLHINVTFSENVTVSTASGVPSLALDTGVAGRAAEYESGNGTATLLFLYTVGFGDVSPSLDYPDTSALALNGGAITDGPGNGADLMLPSPSGGMSLARSPPLSVDGEHPTVVRVTSPNASRAYALNETVRIDVVFSETLVVDTSSGRPYLSLDTGANESRAASYESWNGTTTLLFLYTVGPGDGSSPLNYPHTMALDYNGSTIRDGLRHDANLALPDPDSASSLAGASLSVDGEHPTIERVTSPNASRAYALNETIHVNVVFSENVTVDTSSGVPYLSLDTGAAAARAASYDSGNGTTTLLFLYTVGPGDRQAAVNYPNTTALDRHGGAIRDLVGHMANLELPDPAASSSLAGASLSVDGDRPTITLVSSPSAPRAYALGENIAVNVTFSEPVVVDTSSGTPYLSLDTGAAAARFAPYDSGSGARNLVFLYTVGPGDGSSAINYPDTMSLVLNGSTIRDLAGHMANLALPDPSDSGLLAGASPLSVDGTPPAVRSVSSPNATKTYRLGDAIHLHVNFTEPVRVVAAAGTPYLALKAGGGGSSDGAAAGVRTAPYDSGSGTATLVFAYTVAAGDSTASLDYANRTALVLNGSLIVDAAGNGAALALPAEPGEPGSLGNSSGIAVNGTAPADVDDDDGPTDRDNTCSIELLEPSFAHGRVEAGRPSEPVDQTIMNRGGLDFRNVTLNATPWHVASGNACPAADGGTPYLPPGLTEIRTAPGGAFTDLGATGTVVAAGLEAGANASLSFRLDSTGHPDRPRASIVQCITYTAECQAP